MKISWLDKNEKQHNNTLSEISKSARKIVERGKIDILKIGIYKLRLQELYKKKRKKKTLLLFFTYVLSSITGGSGINLPQAKLVDIYITLQYIVSWSHCAVYSRQRNVEQKILTSTRLCFLKCNIYISMKSI